MNVRHDFPPCPAPDPDRARGPDRTASQAAGRLRNALATTAGLTALWAVFHGSDPAAWIIGVPTVLLGGAATLVLPASPPPRLSLPGVLRFAAFGCVGILRGAVDVSRRSLAPAALRPGCLRYRTSLPEGRPRRLFALAITLMPGTLTARIDGPVLTVHALDLTPATQAELAALERRVADLFRIA